MLFHILRIAFLYLEFLFLDKWWFHQFWNPNLQNVLQIFVLISFSTRLKLAIIRRQNMCNKLVWNGILLPKLFWPTVRKKCSRDLENLLKFEVEGQVFAKMFEIIGRIYSNSERSKQFLVTTCSWRFLISNRLEQLQFKLEKILGFRNMQENLENMWWIREDRKNAGQMKKMQGEEKTGRTIETENGCSSNDKTRILPVIKKALKKTYFPCIHHLELLE